MRTKRKKHHAAAIAATAITAIALLGSCTTVKEYQKNKLK
jgi:hypothetical protein